MLKIHNDPVMPSPSLGLISSPSVGKGSVWKLLPLAVPRNASDMVPSRNTTTDHPGGASEDGRNTFKSGATNSTTAGGDVASTVSGLTGSSTSGGGGVASAGGSTAVDGEGTLATANGTTVVANGTGTGNTSAVGSISAANNFTAAVNVTVKANFTVYANLTGNANNTGSTNITGNTTVVLDGRDSPSGNLTDRPINGTGNSTLPSTNGTQSDSRRNHTYPFFVLPTAANSTDNSTHIQSPAPNPSNVRNLGDRRRRRSSEQSAVPG
jgi:hypothetical protein